MNSKSMAGWIGFAGILLLVVGSIDFFQGLIALFDDNYYVVTASGFLLVDLTAIAQLARRENIGACCSSSQASDCSRGRVGRAGSRSWSCP